jgi:hypothetical protein
LPKDSKKIGDKMREFGLAHRANPTHHPDATPAMGTLQEAIDRMEAATSTEVTIDVLRVIAEAMERASLPGRPKHRPKGATQYSPDDLRAHMQFNDRKPLPCDGRFQSKDRALAHQLYTTHKGEFGSTEDGIYKRIRRLRAETRNAWLAAVEAFGPDEAGQENSLLTFLMRGQRPTGS